MKNVTHSQAAKILFLVLTLSLSPSIGSADDWYSPEVDQSYPTRVYWGDTHLHTSFSVDASGFGNDALTPDDAYRFAKGEAVRAHNGQPVRLRRPLDFLVVADHAVNLAVLPRIAAKDPMIMKSELGKRWAQLLKEATTTAGDVLTSKTDASFASSLGALYNGRLFYQRSWSTDYFSDKAFRQSVWDEVCANADRHNDPGSFMAFIGYEWTPATGDPKSPNLHRNVIFEGGADEAGRVLPFSVQDSRNVEDLWSYLSDYEEQVGGQVLAIPHNGNLSSGAMFSLKDFDGRPITVAYAETRARWEPIYEVTQYKGDSETHPVLSPTDEFADFERWDVPGFFGKKPANFEELKRSEYVRSALKTGLNQKVELGVNPFKFGMIGSTDAHTSLPTADEDNYWGKLTFYEPSPYRITRCWHFGASGYAAVWATENSRRALFAAMKRRETYATTGPRMTVRFFGGWDYAPNDATRPGLARIGYAKGVPMGGDLSSAPEGKAPIFLIRAVKDPDGANLDRLQVIKGWRDKNGALHEAIYNVALSDGRKADRKGRIKPVGNTVDVKDASYTNSIGDPELAAVWKDPDFNRDELAFYYVRVLQIPTPRWTAFDAKRFGLANPPAEIPMVVQDRAYTSPIWYTP